MIGVVKERLAGPLGFNLADVHAAAAQRKSAELIPLGPMVTSSPLAAVASKTIMANVTPIAHRSVRLISHLRPNDRKTS
jgi:hypothetical protein